ncbi:MAG: hypothetical protein ACRCSP_01780 [Rhodoglobus sp.]
MRWESLFDDLESQLEREISADEVDLDAEEERLRLGRLSVRDRLVALQDAASESSLLRFGVVLANGDRVVVNPVMIGRDWLSADLVEESPRRRQCIIPLTSISGFSMSSSQLLASLQVRARDGEAAHPTLSARLGLPFVLRDLCRRRRSVEVVTMAGVIHGTIDRVGRDHFDLAVHERGSARRATAVTELRLVPLPVVTMVCLS